VWTLRFFHTSSITEFTRKKVHLIRAIAFSDTKPPTLLKQLHSKENPFSKYFDAVFLSKMSSTTFFLLKFVILETYHSLDEAN
jgi:hypothetical protein